MIRWMLMAALVLGAACVCVAAPGDDAWIAAQPKFYQIASDHAAVTRLLAQLQQRYPDFQQRLRAVALLRVGTPYVLGCLGEEKGRDTRPVFRLDESDCTVHVLTSSALAHAHTYDEARARMYTLNYYPLAAGRDPVTYTNRVHFTEDRLVTSRYFHDLTPLAAGKTPLASVTLTLNRGDNGKKPLDIPWEKRATIRYLAVADVTPAVLARLPKYAAGVAFVRKKLFSKGMAVGHEGMIIDRKWLIHADSIGKKTARVDFLEFLRKNSDWFDGVILYSFVE